MGDELSELNFQQDLEEALRVENAQRWKIERAGPLEIYVEMWSITAPNEKFQARLLWGVYPGLASLKFRDQQTGRLDMPTAWPIVRGFRPANLDACVNWCSEGMGIHPEWKNDPKLILDPGGNHVLRTLRILQSEMDDYYNGRFKQ